MDLTAAVDESFKNSAFNDQQKTQLLDLCTRYRSVFSSTHDELGRCTIGEAEFPLQKNTKPVDRYPYRTNLRAQEVIDKCADKIESAGIVEKKTSAWGLPVFIVAKAGCTPRFWIDYRTALNKSLILETWPMPDIESHIDTVGVVRNSSQCATYRVLTGK